MKVRSIDVRISGLCAALVISLGLVPLSAQVSDPGASQDAEAAREKLLKASDQLDLMESNSEATKTSVETLKAELAKVQDDNATLRQQVTALQDAFNQSELAHGRERQVLLDEVAKMVAAGKSSPGKSSPRKKEPAAETAAVGATSPAEESPAPPETPAPPNPPATDPAAAPAEASAKPQKGYYHIVESHETLTLISSAYRQQGVNVSVAEIRKANGLTDKSVLKVGQKLFIPKPGT